jgi:hypothetical protein
VVSIDPNQDELNAFERRAFLRLPMVVPVELRMNRLRLSENTINIGGGGVLVTCSHDAMRVGIYATVIFDWPLVHESAKRQFAMRRLTKRGRVVRSESGRIAIEWKRSKVREM